MVDTCLGGETGSDASTPAPGEDAMALPYPTLPGDVDRAVADDLAAVLRLLEHLEEMSGDRRTLADQLVHRFASLSAGLEQVVFPTLKDHNGDAVDGAVSAQ